MQNGNQKKTRVVILLSYKKKKNPLKYRLLEKTKKGHHKMIKRSIQECL